MKETVPIEQKILLAGKESFGSQFFESRSEKLVTLPVRTSPDVEIENTNKLRGFCKEI
jgi:hypothetical protein